MKNIGFSTGLKAGTSIAIGYFPIALTFGLLAKTTGLSLLEATAMSLFVFAGASQYIALSLITKGVDPLLIVLNTFIVNIRHLLMTASLNEKMHKTKKTVKSIYAFGVTDETFSILATRPEEKLPSSFAFGVMFMAYGSWCACTALGHMIGANLPQFLQAAMTIALYAMFIGLLVPSMKGSKKVIILALLAGAIHSCLFWTGVVSTGWAILIAALVSSIVVEVFDGRRQKGGIV